MKIEDLYRLMLLIRRFEQKVKQLYLVLRSPFIRAACSG